MNHLYLLVCGILCLSMLAVCRAAPLGLLPITGTFLDVAYDERMTYTNNVSASLTCPQWVEKVAAFHSLGVDTIIFQAVHDARWGSYYPSDLPFMALWGGACPDVVGTVLSATSNLGMSTFLSCEYVHTEFDPVRNSTIMAGRLEIMKELTTKYALHHASFRGWYFSAEAYLEPYFPPEFFPYIETLSAAAKQLTPDGLIFISPYGTRYAVNDETFVNQLKSLPVDIVAYQDEVGCVRDEFPVLRSGNAFQTLAAAHRAANRSVIWANVESFTWERMPNNVTSPLIPAEFSRMMAQWLAVAQAGVAKVISFTMQGMFEQETAKPPWGGPNATYNARLYESLFRKENGSSHQLLTVLRAINGSVSHQGIGASVVSSSVPAAGFDVADLSDGLCGPQSPYSSLWNAYFVEPELPLIVTIQRTMPWDVTNAAVHVLRVPPIWFKDGMWYNPIPRNFTSDMPAFADFYVSVTNSSSSMCVDVECVASSALLIGSVADVPLAQTTYDFRTALFAVEKSGAAVPGNTVTAVVRVNRPSFVVLDEVLVNF